jgi:hypothetical protein
MNIELILLIFELMPFSSDLKFQGLTLLQKKIKTEVLVTSVQQNKMCL